MVCFCKFPGRLSLARALARRGDKARNRGAFATAAEMYRLALKHDPTRTDIYVQYGHMSKEIGRYQEAEAAYRCALSRSPGDGETHLQFGHLLKLTGQVEQAFEAFKEAQRLMPDNAIPSAELRNLGFGARRTEPDTLSDELEYETHIRAGDRLRNAQRYADAAEAYGAALALAPFRTDIRVQYANMLRGDGRFAEAESNYRVAAAESPEDAEIYLQLGHVFKLLGKRAAALQTYGQAAKLAPFWLAPQQELFQLGRHCSQELLFEAQLRLGGVDALAVMTQSILEMRRTLDHLAEALPDIQSQMAFPVGCYDRFRAIYDVPIPPRLLTLRSFAVLLLADREPLETLYAQLAAITSQVFERWRLYVIGTEPARRRAVERAAASDARIQWVEPMLGESPAEAERRVALSSGGDWLVLLSERGVLHARALEWFASVSDRTAAGAFITDEEIRTGKCGCVRHSSPEFRQLVDYDTLLEMNTSGETVAVELATYAAVAHWLVTSSVSASRSSLLLALARDGRVGHIPHPLVCRDGETIVDPAEAAAAHEQAVRAHILRASLGERIQIGPRSGPLPRLPIVWRACDPGKSIALIIATRDNGPDLAQLVETLRATAAAPEGFRIVIVDNGSREQETRRVLAELKAKECARILRLDEPFNWSRLNNRAVEAVDSPLLVFANDDMRMLSEKWDEHVRGLLERPEIGAIGARLLYEDDTVQHAGVLFGWNGSVIHDGLCASSTDPGPASRWQVSRAVGAVTGAFLATRRDVFLAHHGYDEVHLAVSYSDIDYGLKLRASGLKVLWTPAITLYHYESKTRGLDHLDPEKCARDAAERGVMEARWGAAMVTDPSVNPIWHMTTLPFRLLSVPSQPRVWAHIERCTASDPWLPEREDHRCSPQDRA